MKNLVTNGFKNYEADALVTKGTFIYTQMGADVQTFPAPDPALSVVQDAVKELSVANVEAGTGDKIKKLLWNKNM